MRPAGQWFGVNAVAAHLGGGRLLRFKLSAVGAWVDTRVGENGVSSEKRTRSRMTLSTATKVRRQFPRARHIYHPLIPANVADFTFATHSTSTNQPYVEESTVGRKDER